MFTFGTLYTIDGVAVARYIGNIARIYTFRDYTTGLNYDVHPDDASTRVTAYTGNLT